MTTPAKPIDPQYNYTKYGNGAISTEMLDNMAKSLFSDTATTGWFSLVIIGFKLTVALAYVFARAKLIDKQLLIDKQVYEQNQANNNNVDVNNDPIIKHTT